MALYLLDATPNGNNLTNNNGSTEYTTSLPFTDSTSAVQLDDTSNQNLSITDANQTGLDLSGDFTLEAWVRYENLPANTTWYTFISKGVPSITGAYLWRIYNDGGTYYVRIDVSDDGSNYSRIRWTVTPSADTWYHYAISWDASSSETGFLFYVNGSSQGVGTIEEDGNVTSLFNSSDDFVIGATSAAGGQDFDGQLDEVRVWSDIRSGSEISNNYQKELIGSEGNLVAYYPFEALPRAGILFNLV